MHTHFESSGVYRGCSRRLRSSRSIGHIGGANCRSPSTSTITGVGPTLSSASTTQFGDFDGLRQFAPPMWPIDRLLRSLREHPQYTPEDSRWVCVGYAPHARLYQEGARPDIGAAPASPGPDEDEGDGEPGVVPTKDA